MRVANVYITPSSYSRAYFKKDATVSDTIKLIKEYASTCGYQVAELAKELDAPTVEEYCRNIWNWVKANIAYKEDIKGREQVRQPARTIADRFTGVDCDCYTTFISTLLHLKNISHDYRVVSWTAPGKWAHIYPVAYDKNGNSYAIDCIPEISRFNQQLKFTDNMDLEGLAGARISDADLMEQAITIQGYGNEEYDGSEAVVLYGMVEAESNEAGAIRFNGAQMASLNEKDVLDTLEGAHQILTAEEEHTTELSGVVNVPQELRNIKTLIKNWKDVAQRDETLSHLADNSNFSEYYKNLQKQLAAGAELRGLEDHYFVPIEGYHDYDEELGKFQPFKKIKASIKKVKAKIAKTGIGKVIGKIKKAVNKVRPELIALRNAFLLVMKGDVGGHASFLKKGLITPEDAKSRGISDSEYASAKEKYAKVVEVFKNKGGEEKNLRNAIIKGKAKLPNIIMNNTPPPNYGAVKEVDIPSVNGAEELGVAPIVAVAVKLIQGIVGVVKKAKEKKAEKQREKENSNNDVIYSPGEKPLENEEHIEIKDTGTALPTPGRIGVIGDGGGSDDFPEDQTATNNLSQKRTITNTTKLTTDTTEKENENLNKKEMAEQTTTAASADDRPFFKRMWEDHKWWVIFGTIGTVLLIVFVIHMVNRAKKKEKNRALAGRRRQMSVYARPAYRRRSKPKSLNGPLMLAGPRKKKRATKKKR